MDWISVKDRLPPNSVYVLVAKFYSREGLEMYFIRIACRYKDAWLDDKDGVLLKHKYVSVRYWMPLPEPPKDENEMA